MEKTQERIQKWERYKSIVTQKQFNWLNFGCIDWNINESGEVDVTGSFYCHGFQHLDNISKGYQGLRFGKIEGDFVASNIGLTSLEGSPKWIGKEFIVSHNPIKDLNYCPEYIGGNFDFSNCEISSLKGIIKVGKSLICYGNRISVLAILSIHKEMTSRGIPYELAIVQVLKDKGGLKLGQDKIDLSQEEIELLEKDLPENAELLRDIIDYSLIK